jgi:hypothetical protein
MESSAPAASSAVFAGFLFFFFGFKMLAKLGRRNTSKGTSHYPVSFMTQFLGMQRTCQQSCTSVSILAVGEGYEIAMAVMKIYCTSTPRWIVYKP